MGLVDTHVARLPGAFYQKTDPNYILAQAPDFIIFQVNRSEPGPDDFYNAMEKDLYQDSEFKKNYQRLACWDYDVNEHLLLYEKTVHSSPILDPRGHPNQ